MIETVRYSCKVPDQQLPSNYQPFPSGYQHFPSNNQRSSSKNQHFTSKYQQCSSKQVTDTVLLRSPRHRIVAVGFQTDGPDGPELPRCVPATLGGKRSFVAEMPLRWQESKCLLHIFFHFGLHVAAHISVVVIFSCRFLPFLPHSKLFPR